MNHLEGHRNRTLRLSAIVAGTLLLFAVPPLKAQHPVQSPAAVNAAQFVPQTSGGDGISDAPAVFGAPGVRGVSMQGDPTVIQPGTRDYLEPNRPNPFGPITNGTEIAYDLGQQSHVEIHIYDFFYRRILTLIDEVQTAGRYSISFVPDASLPSGMYFYEFKTDRSRELRRMMYIR
ncbi:MAG TPA: T9SS type A sorting domain-containing protein [Candidatus Kapabacteria bacterium]|nr:T9SS type A sorting domain-containing protein [Candidatus Kapabacteria bacterium]